jgi:hypothetical protein
MFISGNIKILLFLILLSTAASAQEAKKQIKTEWDTSNYKSLPFRGNISDHQNKVEDKLSGKKLSLKEMYNLYLLSGRVDAFSPYNEFDFSDLLSETNPGNKPVVNDSLKYFNKTLYSMLQLQKKELNKYDLGIVSKILGISQGAAAAFLALRQFKR